MNNPLSSSPSPSVSHSAFCAGLFFAFANLVSAATYNVTTTTDHPVVGNTINAGTGVITGGAGNGQVTLRSAIIGANSNGVGPHTINVPAGTYNLSQLNPNTPGTTATAGLNDLQIGSHNSTITVIGTGVTPKIVQTVAGNDVITTGFKPAGDAAIVNLTLNNLEISGGTFTGLFVGADDGTVRSTTTITNCNIHNNTISDATFGQGGAIQHGAGNLSISGTTFASNTATNSSVGQGGAIYFSLVNAAGTGSNGSLSISNCTFTSNTSAIGNTFPAGGAIFIAVASNDAAGGAINITNNTFNGNQATGGGDGGAIAVLNTGGRTLNLLRNNFTTNQAPNGNGHAGAIAVHSGVTNINFNRFLANTATSPANGRVIYHKTGNANAVSANDNWWGQNTGPAANDITGATVTATTWLQLRNIASPSTVSTAPPATTSVVTADILGRNSGGPTAAANLVGLPSFPLLFSNPQRGTLSAASTQLVNGQGTVTFTPTNPGGLGGVDATVDNQTVTAAITVNQPPTITSASTTTFTVGTAGLFNLTASGFPAPTVNLTSGTLPSGVTYNSASSLLSGTPAAGTYGTYPVTFTASNGVGSNSVQSFSLVVNPSAQEVKSKPTITANVGGGFHVAFVGNPGQQYIVQFAPSLPASPAVPNWQTLSPKTANSSGIFFVDDAPAGTAMRFYRAIIP